MEAQHEHTHEGVHGGQVIELGDENYHAELTHGDATHKLGVYLLDEIETHTHDHDHDHDPE